MASTNKTDLLKLPQWQDNDKLEMTDLNDAFEKVDTGLATHQAESANKAHGGFDGALVSLSNEYLVPIRHNVAEAINWDKVIYDTKGFFHTTSPDRLKIPEGVSKVRISANIAFKANSNGYRLLRIRKNASDDDGNFLGKE